MTSTGQISRAARFAAALVVSLTLAACSSSGRSAYECAPKGPPCQPGAFPQPSASTAGAPLPPGVGVGEPVPIDLPSALRLAGGQNLDLRGLEEHLRQRHYEMVHAGQWWFPTVRAGTAWNAYGGDVQDTGGDIVDVNKRNAFLGADIVADWEIGDGIFRHLAAQQRARAACADVRAGMNDAMVGAAEGYFELLREQSSLAVAQQSVDLYEAYTAETAAAVEAGKGFQGDYLSAMARLAHSRVRRDSSRGKVRVAAARLRELLNLPSDVELRAVEPQPVPLQLVDASADEQGLIQEALRGRPEIRSARMNSEAARADQNATTTGVLYPDVRVGYRGGLFGDSYNDLNGTGQAAVGLEWKFGRGGIGDSSRQSAAAARTRRTRVNIQAVRQRVVREVTSAAAEVTAQQSAIVSAGQGVKDAEEALSLYQARSELGVNKPLEAIVFEGVLTQARLDYVDAVVNYNKAQMRLIRALGRRPVP